MRSVLAHTAALVRTTNPAYLYAATIAAAATTTAVVLTFHDIMRVLAALPAILIGALG